MAGCAMDQPLTFRQFVIGADNKKRLLTQPLHCEIKKRPDCLGQNRTTYAWPAARPHLRPVASLKRVLLLEQLVLYDPGQR